VTERCTIRWCRVAEVLGERWVADDCSVLRYQNTCTAVDSRRVGHSCSRLYNRQNVRDNSRLCPSI